MRFLRFLKALVKFIFYGDIVDDITYDNRLTICNYCKYKDNKVCSICGCYLKKKAKWSTEKCPKNKW